MSKVRKAVIPAAGLGTRFLPATKAQPKEMIPIVDKPVEMDISLSRLTKHAFGHKILIVKTSDRRVGNGGI